MGIEASGTVYAVMETQQVSARFTKREFVLELVDNPKYPQIVLFQVTGDRISQLDDIRVGDKVRVEFNLRGREWRSPRGETKYFNSLEAWKVTLDGGAARGPSGPAASRAATSQPPSGGSADDDIPF